MKESGTVGEHLHVALAGPFLGRPLAEIVDTVELAPPTTAGILVWHLAKDLRSRGIPVSVVTLDPSAGDLTRLEVAGGLTVVVGPQRTRHSMRDLMGTERRAVCEGVRALKPDIVHAHWCYEYALGALASGVPTLVTAHDWIPAVLKFMDKRYLPYWMGRAVLYFRTLARARHVTAVSPYSAAKVQRFTRAAVEVIPNGVDDALFDSAVDREGTEGDGREPVFLSINNGFGPLNNVRQLLRAFSLLRQRRPGSRLALAGTGYESDGVCERWARARGLERDVAFLGPLERAAVLDAIDHALVLVHPSREENMPLILLEAMARGLPVIGGRRSGGVPWVLDGGEAGLLVDVGDIGAIASGMEALLVNKDLRRRFAEAGHRHARDNFRQSQVTDLYLDAYQRILAEQPRRSGGSPLV